MKTRTGFILTAFVSAMLVAGSIPAAAGPTASGKKKPAGAEDSIPAGSFVVYSDAKKQSNHFFPSGWMGDTSDISVNDAEPMRPHSGRTSLKVGYKAQGGGGWAGVFWQNPANNWAVRPGAGYDLSQHKKLTFWARGEKGGEVLSEVKVGGIKGQYPDSSETAVKNLILSDQWTQYSVDLEGKDLSYIIGGFCVVFSRDTNPSGAVVFLDDIAFTKK